MELRHGNFNLPCSLPEVVQNAAETDWSPQLYPEHPGVHLCYKCYETFYSVLASKEK